MNKPLRLATLALALTLGAGPGARAAAEPVGGTPVAAVPSSAALPTTAGEARVRDPNHADALSECETAVGSSIREVRGKQIQGLQFESDSHAVKSNADQVDVKGSGHYRRAAGAPVSFRYSCAYDENTGATSGVLFHDTDAAPAPPLPVWQADLSKVSPEACESAVATSLRTTFSRATGIVFERDSLKLEPGAEGRTALSGSGKMARSPGMRIGPFHYRCEFDAAGRVAGARLLD